MPGKGKGGKGKGKGKEVMHTPAPPAPVPPAKWNDEADGALLNIIFRLGEFRIQNWNDIHSEFVDRGFPNSKNSCQSRWSRIVRSQYHDSVRNLESQPHNSPQRFNSGHEYEDDVNSSVYPPLENGPHAESSRMGSLGGQTTASPVAGSRGHGRHAPPSVLPNTPRRLSTVPEEVASEHPGEHMPIVLYNEFYQYMGKIEVNNGFRTIEIKNTLQRPDDSVIDPQINTPDYHVPTPLGGDGTPLHPEAYNFDINEFVKSEAFESHGDESQSE